jgi:protein-L-isoaspartate(D-aspartate) O-methyltransferase
MARVPREEFVRPEHRDEAYASRALPLGHLQTVSQPIVVAAMTQAAAPGPEDRALEVGTGSGYQAAVLSLLCRQVVTVERDADLALDALGRLQRLGYSNVLVKVGDGALGHPELAPYDVILVTAAVSQVPPALVDQLAPAGRMVIPIGPAEEEAQQLVRFERRNGSLVETPMFPVMFVPLV